MDPNLFHIDWSQLLEVLSALVVLSFVIERGLSIVFEHKLFVKNFANSGIKEVIAFGVALLICWKWDFDIVSVVLTSETTSLLGQVITAAVLAGGSKASIKLFHDVLDVKSTAEDRRQQVAESETKKAAAAAG
jgi:hypothetical protein